jgi:hypothetical protein
MLDVPMGNGSGGDKTTQARQLGIRLALSAGVAAAVAATVLLVGWRSFGSLRQFRMEWYATAEMLKDINRDLAEYQSLHDVPLRSLEEFRSLIESRYPRDPNGGDMPLDGWGRPLIFSLKDGKPLIVSYGRDGKPGGAGLDNDLSNEDIASAVDHRLPEKVRPTFSQFFVDSSAGRLEINCLVSGLLAFGLSMSLIKTATFHRRDIPSLLLKLALTMGGTLVTAALIGLTDLPNPH